MKVLTVLKKCNIDEQVLDPNLRNNLEKYARMKPHKNLMGFLYLAAVHIDQMLFITHV